MNETGAGATPSTGPLFRSSVCRPPRCWPSSSAERSAPSPAISSTSHHPVPQGSFPWVTLVINLSGSLAIGVLVPLTEHVAPRAPWVRPLLVVGFLGGWTTYSTLAVEATLLAKDGDISTFVAYVAATVIGGLALVVAGNVLGRRMVPA